jgi:hypothetical protein
MIPLKGTRERTDKRLSFQTLIPLPLSIQMRASHQINRFAEQVDAALEDLVIRRDAQHLGVLPTLLTAYRGRLSTAESNVKPVAGSNATALPPRLP